MASSGPHPSQVQCYQPGKVTVALLGTGVLVDVVKMRLCSIEGALMPRPVSLQTETQRQTCTRGKRPREGGGRGWRGASMRRGTPGTAGAHQEPGASSEGTRPCLCPGFRPVASTLQRIHCCRLKPLAVQPFVTATQGHSVLQPVLTALRMFCVLGTDEGPTLSGVQRGKNEGRETVGGVRQPMSQDGGGGMAPRAFIWTRWSEKCLRGCRCPWRG